MKTSLFVLWLVVPALSWGLSDLEATFLLDRAGLGATEAERQALLPLTREQAVDWLLSRPADAVPSDDAALVPLFVPVAKDPAAKKDQQRAERARWVDWQGAFLQRLATTSNPVAGRLELFWNGHFTTAFSTVKSVAAMEKHQRTLRRYALGNFRDLVRAMTTDPAMMVYLDLIENRSGKPNENYARELMELFTLGEGQYSETDVAEAARALTGLQFDRTTGDVKVVAKQHDPGTKTFLGRSGALDWNDVIDAIFAQPAASRYLPSRLYRYYVGQPPADATLDALATVFRTTGFELAPLVRAILISDAFWQARTDKIARSPLELVVVSSRWAGVPPDPKVALAFLRKAENEPGEPPSVKGWPQGNDWINADALTLRQQYLKTLASHLSRPLATTLTQEAWNFQ